MFVATGCSEPMLFERTGTTRLSFVEGNNIVDARSLIRLLLDGFFKLLVMRVLLGAGIGTLFKDGGTTFGRFACFGERFV